MSTYIKTYLLTFVIFMGIDFMWLGLIARGFYREQIGFIMKDNFNMGAAFIFYILFIVGLLFFVLNKAFAIESWQYALFAGMFYGFITYATYDLTNLSTLKDWPILLSIVDIAWGTVLCGLTSYLTYIISSYLNFF
ncbi:MAG: DUF2177 family protein [Halanaerobiales bacterium]|nr:DUF2177 family protein [Halanaerobiales bacterium]